MVHNEVQQSKNLEARGANYGDNFVTSTTRADPFKAGCGYCHTSSTHIYIFYTFKSKFLSYMFNLEI